MLRQLRKYNNYGLGRAFVLVAALLLILVSHSCRNPGEFTVTSRTELERFMSTGEDIRDLFEFDIYARDTFSLDSGAATFRFARIASKVQGNNFIPTDTSGPDTNAFGIGPFIIASRLDRYDGTFLQLSNPSGPGFESRYRTSLLRRALFMKLGSDADRFFGWELVGLDLGLPLNRISNLVTIKEIPARLGFPTVLSNYDIDFDRGELKPFTFLINYKAVKAGDSIDIQTKVGPMTVFARTSTGFRQLSGLHGPTDPPNVFHYGFRVPPSDPQNRFYHLITFQQGPETAIDSTIYRRFVVATNVVPLIPPDTQITTKEIIPDTTVDSMFDFVDTCNGGTLSIDTLQVDPCTIKEFDGFVDTTINFTFIFDTTVITTTIDTTFDSVLAPATSLVDAKLWVFPYSVVK